MYAALQCFPFEILSSVASGYSYSRKVQIRGTQFFLTKSLHLHIITIFMTFADYLCSDVIQQQELSPSCKENEDPTEKLPKKSTKVVATLQKLSDNKKDCKSAMSEEDVFEDDEVFQQYMPQNVDSDASKPVQNLHPSDNSGQLKGIVCEDC